MNIGTESQRQSPTTSGCNNHFVRAWTTKVVTKARIGRHDGGVGHVGGRDVAQDHCSETTMKSTSPWTHDGKRCVHVFRLHLVLLLFIQLHLVQFESLLHLFYTQANA